MVGMKMMNNGHDGQSLLTWTTERSWRNSESDNSHSDSSDSDNSDSDNSDSDNSDSDKGIGDEMKGLCQGQSPGQDRSQQRRLKKKRALPPKSPQRKASPS